MLKIADVVLNFINPLYLVGKTIIADKDLEFEYFSRPDNEISDMFEGICKFTPTRRLRVDLQWILRFPWMVSSPLGDRIGKKYFFSSNPKRFDQSIVKVYKNDILLGFIIFNLTNDKLSVPYCSFNQEDSKVMAKAILLHAINFKASMVTVYQPNLVNAIKQRRLYRLFSKRRTQIYFATKELTDELNGKLIFNDGDGDCAFI